MMSQLNYTTLMHHLSDMPDPRDRRGQRYEWLFMLTLIAAALLAGQRSLSAMVQWLLANRQTFLDQLRPRQGRLPSYATVRRTLCRLDIEQLERRVQDYTRLLDQQDAVSGSIMQQDGKRLQGRAVDGKTLRGASAHGETVHLVSVVRHESGAVLAQQATGAVLDEARVGRQLLAELPLTNTVTTLDALYTQRGLAEQILAAGGHYLMVVKGNRSVLYREIEMAFSVLPPTNRWEAQFWHYDQIESREQQRGRDEVRRLERTTALNDYLQWPQVRQVLRRTYQRMERRTGRRSNEVHYAVTSLDPALVSLEQVEQLWRWHWTIENCTHYIRDVSFGEDACQVRSGSAPQALAALRNAILTALRFHGWACVPNALRRFNQRPQLALRFLGAIAT